MGRLIDLTGQKFADLTVVERVASASSGQARWRCRCSCGGVTVSAGADLRRGHVTSCGCARVRANRAERTTHGAANSPEYEIWHSMIARCERPSHHAYERYGGRGISIHPTWRASFAAFLCDVGHRPAPHLSIDRIDNDGNYEPGNVRWATAKEQAANRRAPRTRSRP